MPLCFLSGLSFRLADVFHTRSDSAEKKKTGLNTEVVKSNKNDGETCKGHGSVTLFCFTENVTVIFFFKNVMWKHLWAK